MIRSALLAAALFAGAAPALAGDARLASRRYNESEVVRIEGRLGVQATIAFADSEHIENVAIGDANSWQVTPNKRANILFVKPLEGRARTNLTVVTDKRTYFFDLVASPTASPLYVLRFTYPPEKSQPAGPQTAQQAALTGVEQQAVTEKPVDPAELNFAWVSKGARQLLPARVYDDGDLTYLSWPAGAPVPAMLIRNEKGVEGPVNYAVRGDVIVIEGVHKVIVLRSGKASATLENNGPVRQPARPSEPPAALAAAALPAGSASPAVVQSTPAKAE